MKIYCINNNQNISREILAGLESLTDEQKLVRIKKYRRQEDYENALLADALARFAVLENTGERYIRRPFLFNEYGKPGVPDDMTLQFNVSHSGQQVACAAGDKAIGIDVQLMEKMDLPDIARRFFAPEEFRMLTEADDNEKKELFYDLWTLKESYIKALGKGLSIKLDAFCIIKTQTSIRYETQLQHEPCYFKQYSVDDQYKLSVCSFSDDFPAEVTYITAAQLYQSLSGSI